MRAPFTNWRVVNWGCVAPWLACLAVVAGIVVGALALHGHCQHLREPVAASTTHTRPNDELSRELARCQAIGARAEDDRDCIAAWTENRRRFFGGAAAALHPAPPSPSSTKSKGPTQP